MADWTTEYINLIEDCEKRQSMCTEWEIGFLASIRSQVEQGRRPTPKQVETLDGIWEKATARG